MANETEKTIILSIDLNTEELVKQASAAQQAIDELVLSQKQIEKQSGKNSAAYIETSAALREQKVILREANKGIDDRVRALNSEAGSVREMRAQLSVMTAQYNKLKGEQRENTEEGKAFTKSIKDLSDKLKVAEGAIGDNRRSVGNYAGAIKDTLGSMNLLPKGFEGIVSGATSAGNAFKALAVNPIVFVITALVAGLLKLADAFSKTEEGGNEFAAIAKQISNVVDVVIQRLARLAGGIVDIFKGNFKEGAEKMSSAFSGITEQINNASKAARDYVFALDAIEDAQTSFVSETAKNRNEIAKLEAIAADQTKSVSERRNALKEAIKIQETELLTTKKFADDKLKVELDNIAATKGVNAARLKEFIAASGEAAEKILKNDKDVQKAVNSLGDEGIANLEKLFSESINLDTQFFEENKRNLGKLSGFEKDIADSRKAANEKATQEKQKQNVIQLNDKKAALELELAGEEKFSARSLELKLQILEAEKEIELATNEFTNNQKLVVDEQYKLKAVELAKSIQKEKEEEIKKSLDLQIKAIEDATDKQNMLFAQSAIARKQTIEEQYSQGLIDAETYQQQLADIEFEAEQQKKQNRLDEIAKEKILFAEGSAERIALETEAADLSLQIFTDAEAKKRVEIKKTTDGQRAAVLGTLAVANDVFATIGGLFKKGSEASKVFAELQIIASTATAAINAYSSAAAIPVVGFALAPVAAAAAVVAGMQQLANVRKLEDGGTVIPKAARGIVLGGQPHSQGGTKFVGSDGTRFEAERGELLTVVNKRSTAMLQSLSNLNQLGGGIDFFKHGGLKHLADGGIASRSMTVPINEQISSNDAIREFVLNMPRPVVVVQDINEAQGSVVEVETRAVI